MQHAAIHGTRVGVASIGAVGTDPEHRGAGLASRLLAQARQAARGERASLMLISGDRGLYRRQGYVEVGCFHAYSVPAGPRDATYGLSAFRDEDLPSVMALHQREPVRFFRSPDDWQRLLQAGMLMNQPSDLWLIRQGGEPVAYAAVQRPSPGPSGEMRAARVQEIAGSRAALAGILQHLAQHYGVPLAEVVVQPDDLEWRALAAERGWCRRTVPFYGTVGVISPWELKWAVEPLIQERAGSALRLWSLSRNGAELECAGQRAYLLKREQLTALLFGGETEDARAVPPLPPLIQEAVARALPLPLPWYGYNYV